MDIYKEGSAIRNSLFFRVRVFFNTNCSNVFFSPKKVGKFLWKENIFFVLFDLCRLLLLLPEIRKSFNYFFCLVRLFICLFVLSLSLNRRRDRVECKKVGEGNGGRTKMKKKTTKWNPYTLEIFFFSIILSFFFWQLFLSVCLSVCPPPPVQSSPACLDSANKIMVSSFLEIFPSRLKSQLWRERERKKDKGV